MMHKVKCINPFFEDVLEGRKTFEVRKNDRNYKIGDLMILWEYNPEREQFMKRHCVVEIVYIYQGTKHGKFGLHKGYVILGIKSFEASTMQKAQLGER